MLVTSNPCRVAQVALGLSVVLVPSAVKDLDALAPLSEPWYAQRMAPAHQLQLSEQPNVPSDETNAC